MEQSFVEPKQKSVIVKQIIAIVLLLLLIVWSAIDSSGLFSRLLADSGMGIESISRVYQIIPILTTVVKLIAYVLLFTTAINKTTKIAVGILGVASICVNYVLLPVISHICNAGMVAWSINSCLRLAIICSGYILILKNTVIKDRDRSWIVVLILCSIFTLIWSVANNYEWFMITSGNDFQVFSYHKYLFLYILLFFECIATVKLVRCGIFDGNNKNSADNATTYPIAKYIVGIVVAIAFMALAACIIVPNSNYINHMMF